MLLKDFENVCCANIVKIDIVDKNTGDFCGEITLERYSDRGWELWRWFLQMDDAEVDAVRVNSGTLELRIVTKWVQEREVL